METMASMCSVNAIDHKKGGSVIGEWSLPPLSRQRRCVCAWLPEPTFVHQQCKTWSKLRMSWDNCRQWPLVGAQIMQVYGLWQGIRDLGWTPPGYSIKHMLFPRLFMSDITHRWYTDTKKTSYYKNFLTGDQLLERGHDNCMGCVTRESI